MRHPIVILWILLALGSLALLQSCKNGGSGGNSSPAVAPAEPFLSVEDVETVLAQAISEAQARGLAATVAVVDRVGNVLAVFRMNGAAETAVIDSGRDVATGLEGVVVPATLAAIAKAVTGAYLSSRGNAFTSRTASQIVQEHFNPKELGQPGGPLFGVQFSQLPCSDLSVRFVSGSPHAFVGPKRSPLGLSADPGGLPLYKGTELVGGVGIMADSVYGLDLDIGDFDNSVDELISVAATIGFAAPEEIRANRITVEGKSLRFTDLGPEALMTSPADAPAFVDGVDGVLVSVTGYFDGAVVAGEVFNDPASGIRLDDSGTFGSVEGFVLVDGTNLPRFAPTAGTDSAATALTEAEVITILTNALEVANRARAQIRRPLNSHAEVSISIVDTNGRILGVARTRDAPVFGIDVSLQKARTAAFFSNPNAGDELIAAGTNALGTAIEDYVTAVRAFVAPTALSDGIAFSDRAGGNLSRPFYPDGIDGNVNGPFSRPFDGWSPFSTGLQLDLVVDNLVQHLQFVTGAAGTDTSARCTGLPLILATGSNRVANGIQIFPGSVPIFRDNQLIGGIGVSGDGVDQDDLIAFLGLHNAGVELATGIGNAPAGIRADTLEPMGVRLRYVNCPFEPFLDSDEQNVCANK